MAFVCGFFNSINKDRLYNAEDMNNPYKRIVSNGVFARPYAESSTDFQVLAGGSMKVIVSIGDGIFKDKWAQLTAPLILTLPTASTTLNRYDSIVVKIDETDSVRAGSIYVKSGEYATEPTPPSLVDTDLIKEYRLANILVEANAEEIGQDKIEDTRPSADCGWITNLLWKSDITATYKQWEAQFKTWFDKIKESAKIVGDITIYKQVYTTTEDNESEIAITLTWDYNFDFLEIYVSGLLLVENTEYTIDTTNKKVIFINPLDKGTICQFICFHKNKKDE